MTIGMGHQKYLTICVFLLMSQIVAGALNGFTISPSHIVPGLTRQMTLRCELGHYVHAVSHALVIQLSKVDGKQVATLASQQEKSSPVLIASSLNARAKLEGKIDPTDVPATYLQLTLSPPIDRDSGYYICSITVMDLTNYVQTFTLNASVSEDNASTSSLLASVKDLHHLIRQLNEQVDSYKANNTALLNHINTLEKELQNTKTRTEASGRTLETHAHELLQINTEIFKLNSTCSAACVQEIDGLRSGLNDTNRAIKDGMDLIYAQANSATKSSALMTLGLALTKRLILEQLPSEFRVLRKKRKAQKTI